jgi:ribonuclease P protein component
MIPKKFRAEKKQIEETIKRGLNIYGKNFYLRVSRSKAEKAGFSVVISKKTEKTSVGRHKIKRQVMSVIESLLSKINKNTTKTVVVYVKKSEKPLLFADIKKEIIDLFKNTDIFLFE